MNVRGSKAFVTGANRGIGRELVKALLDAGAAKIYAAARNAASFGDRCDMDMSKVVHVELDITNQQQIERAARGAHDVDLLINNAAVLEFDEATAVAAQVARLQFDVNVWGAFGMTRAFIGAGGPPDLQAVATILSLIALRNAPAMAAYSASKAAAWSFTQSFRESLRPRGIAVHAVFPGAVDTDMLAPVQMQKASPLAVAQAIVAGIQAGRENIYPDSQSMQWVNSQRQASFS